VGSFIYHFSFLILHYSFFMKLSRLRGRKHCAKVLKDGKVWKGRTLVVRWLPGAPRHPLINPDTPAVYVGVLASARLNKSAVKRNRMRRRIREALRKEMLERTTFPTIQLLLSPRSSSLTCGFADIQADVRSLQRFSYCSTSSRSSRCGSSFRSISGKRTVAQESFSKCRVQR